MTDLQRRLDDLRRQLQNFSGDGAALAALEREARALLTDAKNTPYEGAVQALFAEVARTTPGSKPARSGETLDASVRGLVRRARIRLDIAGSDEDIDEAIDILAQALDLASQHNAAPDPDVIGLLRDSSQRSPQAAQRVGDLFLRYGVKDQPRPSTDTATMRATPTSESEDDAAPRKKKGKKNADPAYPTSSGYPAPEQEIASGRRAPGKLYSNLDIDGLLTEMTQAYYAGDYQRTVDAANRVLAQQPGNPTALDYRQKAEDNIIRGVVPDHRIPFDARVAYNRANSLVRAGNYDEAERLYREARDLANRSGILSWKDAESALMEIQDLALARELILEGDRLMATDNWSEALRKYEGALRVVPNDPAALERSESVRRVQQETDQVVLQFSLLSGTLAEQAAQLHNISGILARMRQVLPNSKRLAQLTQDVSTRLSGIKSQLHDQAQAAVSRVENTTALEERLHLSNEALKLLEMGVELDPGDAALSALMLETRARTNDMQRARQVIERAAALIAQNFDNELGQARSMLAGLRDYAQDDRYRAVVSDLLARYVERADYAIHDGDLDEAQNTLDMLREEPFRVLGRRAEIGRLETALRSRRRADQVRLGAIGGGVILLLILTAAATSGAWLPVLFPPAPTNTPTITPTYTPSVTPTPSDTPTPSNTPTASNTPTWTWTPSPTVTPSWTPTASLTPTHTPTPTETPTITLTPTATLTPTITPTLDIVCRVIVPEGGAAARVRAEPNVRATLITSVPALSVLDVREQERGSDGFIWYYVDVNLGGGAGFTGWVREDAVEDDPTSPCMTLP